jgi:hypothetical protein
VAARAEPKPDLQGGAVDLLQPSAARGQLRESASGDGAWSNRRAVAIVVRRRCVARTRRSSGARRRRGRSSLRSPHRYGPQRVGSGPSSRRDLWPCFEAPPGRRPAAHPRGGLADCCLGDRGQLARDCPSTSPGNWCSRCTNYQHMNDVVAMPFWTFSRHGMCHKISLRGRHTTPQGLSTLGGPSNRGPSLHKSPRNGRRNVTTHHV